MTLIRAVIVEDSEDDLLLLLRALKKGGFETIYTRVETSDDLKKALSDNSWELVISDHAMPRFSAPEALQVTKESGRDLPFIIVSGTIGEEIAVEAMRSGAHDYIMKDNLARLAPAVRRELRDAEIRQQHKRDRKMLEFLTLHDQLTGMYNRIYFENEIKRLEGGQEYPVLLVTADLNGLKLINETMGQKEGDRILQTCAELLQKVLHKGDVLARVGGDEFVAIMPRSTDRSGEEVANQIRMEIDKHNIEHEDVPISMAIGYAKSHDQSEPLEEVLTEANKKLYLDKQDRSESARNQIVQALLAALSERDYIANGHADRLDELCIKMGELLGLDKHRLSALSLVAQVHDLGKVGIPDNILFKKDRLTDEEWVIMRQHPEKGYRIAQTSPELNQVADLILRHHEKWDGSGYPLGLKEDEIPLECRILAIVDAYDAMTNDRPYRQALTREEALEELKRNSGSQFDPKLVELFLSIV